MAGSTGAGADALVTFEKRYKTVLEGKKFLEAGLDLAIAAEVAGRKAYEELGGGSRFTDISAFFYFLANEEKMHYKILNGVKESLASMGAWVELSPGDEAKVKERPPRFDQLLKETDELKKNEIQSIIRSIRIEREFRDFYAGMAKKVDDVNGKRMFSALADFEQKHYDLLSGLYESATETGEYTMG